MTQPSYGVLHNGRIVRPGSLPDTYEVKVAALAEHATLGPYESTVPALAIGDRVLLVQVGPAQSDLVIVGKRPPTPLNSILPIAINDVTGLQAALNDKADDSEITALTSRVTTAETTLSGHTTTLTNNGLAITDHGARLTAAETLNTTQNSRLTAIETLNTAQDSRLTAVETLNTTQDGRLAALEGLQDYHYRDLDLYGDKVSTLPRVQATGSQTLSNAFLYGQRMYTRRTLSVTTLRACVVTTAGVAGTAQMGMYTGADTSSFTLISNTSINLTALGVCESTIAGGYTIPANTHIIVMLAPFGFTTLPKVATSAASVGDTTLINPTGATIGSLSKATASFPTTINLGDGTWTADLNTRWFALL